MQPNAFLGVALHGIGAFSASSCYTPQKQTKLWSWEVYWIMTATFAWLILPIAGAFLTIPNYLDVLAACPKKSCCALLGWGSSTVWVDCRFGLGIRYIGFSLNYAIAIGISAGLGTLFPLIWHPNDGFVWEIFDKFSTLPGQIVLAGILVSLWVALPSADGPAFCASVRVVTRRRTFRSKLVFPWPSPPVCSRRSSTSRSWQGEPLAESGRWRPVQATCSR